MNTITINAAAKYLGIAHQTLDKAIKEGRCFWPVAQLEDLEYTPIKRQPLVFIGDKKRCSQCRKYKLLSEYYRSKKERRGVGAYCKDCSKRKTKKYANREIRFWLAVNKNVNEQGCWHWKNTSRSAFKIQTTYRGKDINVRRLTYQLARGDVPEGMYLLSTCNNHLCINPYHMRLGTKVDHELKRLKYVPVGDDSGARKRPETRPRGQHHGCAKLRDDDVRAIRRLSNTLTGLEISKIYGVDPTTISSIIHRHTWKHVE